MREKKSVGQAFAEISAERADRPSIVRERSDREVEEIMNGSIPQLIHEPGKGHRKIRPRNPRARKLRLAGRK